MDRCRSCRNKSLAGKFRCKSCQIKWDNTSYLGSLPKNILCRYKELGLCVVCGKSPRKNRTTCQKCAYKLSEGHKRHQRKKARVNIPAKVCRECGRPRFGKNVACEKHFFINQAVRKLSSAKFGNKLEQKFKEQNGCCYYTGVPLVAGGNAILFFKVPRGLSQSLGCSLMENVIWCSKKIVLTHSKKAFKQ